MSFVIRTDQDVQPISRFIYGNNFHDFAAARPKNLTLNRAGGNRWTAYNWENNASNAGTDWFNQNDGYLSSSNTPGAAVTPVITTTHAANAAMLVTVPIAGYVAADKNGGGDVNQSGSNYLATRFRQSLPKKNAAFTLTPSTADAFVYQDEFVHFLDQSYPNAKTDANRTIFYSLDNEPDLWASTHPRIRGEANGSSATPVTYAELIQRNIDYADAIKSVVPQALVFGPVNYGWNGMTTLQGAADAAGRDFLDTWLQQMASAQTARGKRLVDVMDIHWYPEARGGGIRITEDQTGANSGANAARMAAPRSLWDATYTESSWITNDVLHAPINLLPRLKQKIAAHYPGTKLAVTEYNYGGSAHISGGIAQADVLGIFGRQGVFAATYWSLGGGDQYVWGGFDMYRNFDGANGSFGDTAIRATNSNIADTSIYASVDSGSADRMVLVAINRTPNAVTTGIQVWHTRLFGKAQIYTLTAASASPQAAGQLVIAQRNTFQYTLPAHSVSTLVLSP